MLHGCVILQVARREGLLIGKKKSHLACGGKRTERKNYETDFENLKHFGTSDLWRGELHPAPSSDDQHHLTLLTHAKKVREIKKLF